MPVLVDAEDNHVISLGNDFVKRLLIAHGRGKASVTLLPRTIKDPRHLRVAETRKLNGRIKVVGVAEKLSKPKSK
jgi:dTDP-glucose pyrophosphorylase